MKKNTLLSLLLVFVLIACDNEDYKQGQVNSLHAISIDKVILPPTGGVQEFMVTSEAAWSVSVNLNNSGITTDQVGQVVSDIRSMITPSEGNPGSTKVKIDSKGAQDYDIDVTLDFKTDDVTFASIPFIQKKPELYISGVSAHSFRWHDISPISFTINSNTDWHFESEVEEWIEISEPSYIYENSNDNLFWVKSKTVTINPKDYNLDESQRNQVLKVIGAAGEKDITISQEHKTLIAKYNDGYDISFGPCNRNKNTKELQVISDFDECGFSTEDASWIEVNYQSNETTAVVTSKANDSRDKKVGYIVLTGYEQDIDPAPKRKIGVTLASYVLGFNGHNKEEAEKITLPWDSNESTGSDVPIFSSGAWELDRGEGSDWLDIKSTKADGVLSGEGLEYNEDQTDLKVSIFPHGKNLHVKNSREGSVILKSKEDGVSLTSILPIEQRPFTFNSWLTDDEGNPENTSNITLNSDDTQEHTLEIRCSGKWDIDVEGDWLNVDTTSGGDYTTVKYNAKDVNKSTTHDREGKITVHSIEHKNKTPEEQEALGYKPIVFNIKQLKYIFNVEPNGGTFEFAALPENNTHRIKITCSASWKIVPDNKKDLSWIKINGEDLAEKEYKGNQDIIVSVSKNTETLNEPREGTFTITGGNSSKKFTIEQSAFVFDTAEEEITNIDAVDGKCYTVLGECMGGWYVQKPDWVSVDPTHGTGGNVDITITPTKNITDVADRDGRTDEIKIISSENDKFVKKISIHQHAHWLIVSNKSVSFAAKPDDSQSVDVDCAAQWTVSADQTWITLNKKQGSFTISATENTGKDKRTATIIVESRGVEEKIEVTQAGK